MGRVVGHAVVGVKNWYRKNQNAQDGRGTVRQNLRIDAAEVLHEHDEPGRQGRVAHSRHRDNISNVRDNCPARPQLVFQVDGFDDAI